MRCRLDVGAFGGVILVSSGVISLLGLCGVEIRFNCAVGLLAGTHRIERKKNEFTE